MKNLTDEQVANLLLTKAMVDSVGSIERWGSLNAVIDELFENNRIDRDEYLHNIMELTHAGFIISDITEEEDIEMSEAADYDIVGLTPDGEKYIEQYLKQNIERCIEQWDPIVKKNFFHNLKIFCGKALKKISEECEKISNNGLVKLSSQVAQILMLFKC